MERVNYVGADVHRDYTELCVLDLGGQEVCRGTVRTASEDLVGFLRGLPGRTRLTFEEGTQARWLYHLLKPHVEEVTVCNARRNKLLHAGNKSDRIDAHKLATLLRAGLVAPVYKDDQSVAELKQLVASHTSLVKDCTRVKSRLKALYRARGIPSGGSSLYNVDKRESWLEKLPSRAVRLRATSLFVELEQLQALRNEAATQVAREARKHKRVTRLLQTVPGIGPLRAARLLAIVVTPHRFPNRQAFWAYCGLLVSSRSTGQWKEQDGRRVRSSKNNRTRGLNRNGNPILKEIFKGAVLQALRHPELRELYDRHRNRGLSDGVSRVAVARKMATVTWAIWKKGVPYNSELLKRDDE